MTAPEVEISVEDPRWDALDDLVALIEGAAAAALKAVCIDGAGRSVSVLLTADGPMAELNGRFRGKPAPTTVLSWPAEDLAPDRDGGEPGAHLHNASERFPTGLQRPLCRRNAGDAASGCHGTDVV